MCCFGCGADLHEVVFVVLAVLICRCLLCAVLVAMRICMCMLYAVLVAEGGHGKAAIVWQPPLAIRGGCHIFREKPCSPPAKFFVFRKMAAIFLFLVVAKREKRYLCEDEYQRPPMTPKTRTLTATAVFLAFAVLFFIPVQVPHKLVFPVATLFVASLGLTPWQICAALFFSALGDWFGTCGNFIAQMGCFAVGHIFYIWFFAKRYLAKVEHDRKLSSRAKGYLAMLAICIAGLLAVAFTQVVPKAPHGIERIGSSIYAVIISLMLLGALLQRSSLYAVGAVLFVFSDFILAWHRFVEPIAYRNYFVLVTYFLAQWCLFVRSTPYRITGLRPFRF